MLPPFSYSVKLFTNLHYITEIYNVNDFALIGLDQHDFGL